MEAMELSTVGASRLSCSSKIFGSSPSDRARVFSALKQIPRRTTIFTLSIVCLEEKMSQQDIQSTTRRGISTRSVVLVILLVGLGAGAVGYGLNNAFAATNPSQTTAPAALQQSRSLVSLLDSAAAPQSPQDGPAQQP